MKWWVILPLFVFRPMGSSMDWIVCKKAYRYDCGIHAYYCNTHYQYKCLTNLESPDEIIPREITQHEFDSLEERLQAKGLMQ